MKPVAAILVNYHAARDTIRCVQSIAEHTRISDCIFIVDNGATAESRHSLEKLKNFHPGLKIFLLFNEKNYGFAAACNQAMKAIEDQGFNGYFWLVNNDTVADQNALKELLEEAEKTDAGITGSKIELPGNRQGGSATIHPFWGTVKRSSVFRKSVSSLRIISFTLKKRITAMPHAEQDFPLHLQKNPSSSTKREIPLAANLAKEKFLFSLIVY